MKKTARIIFVCMGNICRSPAAEGILKHLASHRPSLDIYAESCGIGDWHIGQAPDRRIQEASRARGIVLTSRAQQFQKSFLDHFDYILAADKEVLKFLYHYAKTPEQKAKMYLMTEFSSTYQGQEVPDPYYQSGGAFELVLDMLEDSCEGLLNHIEELEEKRSS
ncbi:low molecular weight protein-tyrosine-phosphatase [Candidatus Protochlamydia phocaeensis]|uniref:low molecular weight protein-tyrosine-phosphatase n=1 Tax=Candidatus Protochlamydia phocaeensis TaxID=1414722 RepID=UPI0008382FF3|nr:low molecular weight protein-tyrosine-phosphatase [Candidatus Protochlamydia phocaeensis]